MMNLMEEMIEKVALDIHGTTEVKVGENVIDFKRHMETFYHVRSYSTLYRN